MSQLEPKKDEGNTRTSSAKYQLYCWFFTLPYETCEPNKLVSLLKPLCKKFTFQGELSKTGYKHWQGNFSLKQKEYFMTVKNLMPSSMHIEATKDIFAAEKYCRKDDTYIEGPYDERWEPLTIIKSLRPWQDLCKAILLDDTPDDRKVFWVWSAKGNNGKTVFCKYMLHYYKATLLGSGKTSDLACALPDNPKIVMINYPKESGGFNYLAIEAIKDGMVFSGKYESKTKVFNSPKLMVFANQPPDLKKMSLDRWVVINLDLKFEYDIMKTLIQMQ